jgi:hypothetical protein
MVDIRSKKCEFNTCQKYPIFNYDMCKTGAYCFEHKLDNMINIRKRRLPTYEINIKKQKIK